MNRRTFTGVFGAALLSQFSCRARAAAGEATLEIGSAPPGPAVPNDFVGLSYESAQLANPQFFCAQNTALIALFRELSPSGNLRLGGGSGEFTTFSQEPPAGPPPFDVFGPDTSKTVKHGTVTSALAIRKLRGFLDATNWNCLYGLNLGQGSVENAVAEATAVEAILGPRLLAFQIGNEPDSFRSRYRPATYGPDDYLAEWNRFRSAIASAVPGARFGGPDISNKLAYLTAFAAQAPQHPDIVLLTSHYYAMGPAGNPAATLDNLLDPNPKLTTLKATDVHVIQEARGQAHLPYRMSEGNSCWDGGKPGVSDTFASALWCADYMLRCMERGWVGLNLHGGGNGFYTAIAGLPSTGFTRRPEFFGIQFAQRFVGARFVSSTWTGASPRVDAFVFERDGKQELALINKTDTTVECMLPAGRKGESILTMHAPAIDAKDGVQLTPSRGPRRGMVTAPAYTATVFRLTGVPRMTNEKEGA